jgi:hypothetical protein
MQRDHSPQAKGAYLSSLEAIVGRPRQQCAGTPLSKRAYNPRAKYSRTPLTHPPLPCTDLAPLRPPRPAIQRKSPVFAPLRVSLTLSLSERRNLGKSHPNRGLGYSRLPRGDEHQRDGRCHLYAVCYSDDEGARTSWWTDYQ